MLSVQATTIRSLDVDVNGSSILSNNSLSNASASLIFASSIVISGRIAVFLPDYIVSVNMSGNYSRIRVTLRASSPSLSFVQQGNSYIDLSPKCDMGKYVASSGAFFECVKCPDGSYSNQVDSRICRCEPVSAVLLLSFSVSFAHLICFQFLSHWEHRQRGSEWLQAMFRKYLQGPEPRQRLSSLSGPFFRLSAT